MTRMEFMQLLASSDPNASVARVIEANVHPEWTVRELFEVIVPPNTGGRARVFAYADRHSNGELFEVIVPPNTGGRARVFAYADRHSNGELFEVIVPPNTIDGRALVSIELPANCSVDGDISELGNAIQGLLRVIRERETGDEGSDHERTIERASLIVRREWI